MVIMIFMINTMLCYMFIYNTFYHLVCTCVDILFNSVIIIIVALVIHVFYYIHSQEGLWGSSYFGDPDDNLRAYRCPPGYCRCSRMTSFGSGECHYVYNNSDPDIQCTCDREGNFLLIVCDVTRGYVGILCGNCKDGKGASVLFNRCVDCNNGFGALIAALGKQLFKYYRFLISILVIVDAIIIIIILLKEIFLPAWLLPAIFNIQVRIYYSTCRSKI